MSAKIDFLWSTGAATGCTYRELAFIDVALQDYQALVKDLDPEIEIHFIHPGMDGLACMAEVLQGQIGIDTIHVFCCAVADQITLGSATLVADNIATYATSLATIGKALMQDSDIFLYGCNVAPGDVGQVFIASMARLRGVDLVASSNI